MNIHKPSTPKYSVLQLSFGNKPLRTIVAIQTSIIDKQEHIEQAARALKSISHPLCSKEIAAVGDQESCVQEIVDAVGTSQSNISQHLAILREKGGY